MTNVFTELLAPISCSETCAICKNSRTLRASRANAHPLPLPLAGMPTAATALRASVEDMDTLGDIVDPNKLGKNPARSRHLKSDRPHRSPTAPAYNRTPSEPFWDKTRSRRMHAPQPSRRPSAPPSLIPDTDSQSPSARSLTVSIPTPGRSSVPAASPTPVSPLLSPRPRNLSPAARRELRYALAQDALRTSLAHCAAEPSPAAQQIAALQRATAALGAQAADARTQVERLQACLRDRERLNAEAGEVEVREMARDRWLAERRGKQREMMTKELQERMTQLMSVKEGSSAVSPTANVSESGRASPRQTGRRKAEPTAQFFERSPTLRPLPARSIAMARFAAGQRRKTMTRVRSLRLRTNPFVFTPPQPQNTPSKHANLKPEPSSSSLTPDLPELHPTSRPTPPQPLASSSSSVSHPRVHSSLCSPLDPSSSSGTARIYSSPRTLPRSKAEILAALADDAIPLPGYAVDLLDELVASTLDVSLRRAGSRKPHGSRAHAPSPSAASSAPPPSPSPSPAPATPAMSAAALPSSSSSSLLSTLAPAQGGGEPQAGGSGARQKTRAAPSAFRRSFLGGSKAHLPAHPPSLASVPESLVSAPASPRTSPRILVSPSRKASGAQDSPRRRARAAVTDAVPRSRVSVLSFGVKSRGESGLVSKVRGRLSALGVLA